MATAKRMEVDSYQQQQQWRPPPMVGLEVPDPSPQHPYHAPQTPHNAPQHPYQHPQPPRQQPRPPKQTPSDGHSSVEVSFSSSQKSLFEAYLLGFTLGFLGAHHFYLRRTWFGVAYFLTLGLLGVGYLVDLLRMPCLVREANMALTRPQLRDRKSKCDAYLLWFPFGLLGFHYFYLRRPAFGALYFFTLGLAGIGWLVDAFRMPWLVREANEESAPYSLQEKSVCMAYILGLSPGGVLGLHHYYLGRPLWGLLYTLTLGFLGLGWFLDWFRIWNLTKRANLAARGEVTPGRKFQDDAYLLWFCGGLSGLHHFYLGRHGWGCLYFFTLGLLGLGWLFDSCRLWSLVKEHNATLEETLRLLRSHANQGMAEEGRGDNSQPVVHVTSVAPGSYPGGSFHPYPPPYTPQHVTPQPPHHVTFQPPSHVTQPPNYGAQGVTFLPTGGPRLETPPPNYEAALQDRPPRKSDH